MATKRIDIMIEEEKKNLEDKIKRYANGLKDGNITVSRFTYEEDIKAEFEASPKLLLEIEQFSDEQRANIVKEIDVLLEASYWVILREAVAKELCKR